MTIHSMEVEKYDLDIIIEYWDGDDMFNKKELLTPDKYMNAIAYLLRKLKESNERIQELENKQ